MWDSEQSKNGYVIPWLSDIYEIKNSNYTFISSHLKVEFVYCIIMPLMGNNKAF